MRRLVTDPPVPAAAPRRRVLAPGAWWAHPLAPAAAAALAGLLYLWWAPATADMAAQDFRTWLWRHDGFTVWNAQWYGGHHVPGYSLLFPPVAALIGPRLVGVL